MLLNFHLALVASSYSLPSELIRWFQSSLISHESTLSPVIYARHLPVMTRHARHRTPRGLLASRSTESPSSPKPAAYGQFHQQTNLFPDHQG